MASRKKESEGIALLSMYYDEEDDEEMEDAEPKQPQQQREEEEGEEEPASADPSFDKDDDPNIESERTVASDSGNDNTPPVVTENFTPQDVKAGASTPQPVSFTSPPQRQQQQQVRASDSRRSRHGRLTIVDYGHDEVAMSPEAEEGEIESGGHNTFGGELQSSNGDFHEKTPPGTVHILTPAAQATTQSPEHREPSESDPMNYAVNDSETGEAADPTNVSEEEPKDVDPLDKFLPSPPTMKCPFDLQKRIDKFLSLKKTGRSFNAEVRNRKDYRNPDFLLHAVRYQDIDQIGSCFSKDVFDPHGYDKSDYVEEIEADMKREMERKEQERKKSQKVEFVSGGNQPAPPKITMPIPVPPSALHSMPTAADVSRDGRQNKKSKWDKVDGDRRNPLPSGGQDAVSAVGTHAALLSAANAGSGYTAFAQQRRREAEEKRSGERRFERRS